MNVIGVRLVALMQTVLIMSLAGSVISLLLFSLKPFVKDRLPKSVQYRMWLFVVVALIVPISKMVVLPKLSTSSDRGASLTPVHYIVRQSFQIEKVDRAQALPLIKNERELEMPDPFGRAKMIISVIWVLAAFAFLGSTLIGYLLFARKLKEYAVPATTREIEILNQLSKSKYKPYLCHSPVALTPMLIGVFRPLIALPNTVYTDSQLQQIFLHELTHFRKKDILIKWLLTLAGVFHWFNPVVYFVRREMGRACELACDEAVMQHLDADGKNRYGNLLTAVVAGNKTSRAILSTTMCEDKKALKERLDAIMKHTAFSGKSVVLSILLIVGVLLNTIWLSASSRDEDSRRITEFQIDASNEQAFINKREIELKANLVAFDKIDDAAVRIASNDGIPSINVLLITAGALEDSEIDELVSLVSESMGSDIKGDIAIVDQHANEIYSSK